MILNPTDREPDFVNEAGIKWWADKALTQYARNKDVHGTSLKLTCFIVEELSGRKTRLLIDQDGVIIFDNPGIENIGVEIDKLKFLKRCEEEEKAK